MKKRFSNFAFHSNYAIYWTCRFVIIFSIFIEPAFAQNNTTITATYYTLKDKLRPKYSPNLYNFLSITLSLSGTNQIGEYESETWNGGSQEKRTDKIFVKPEFQSSSEWIIRPNNKIERIVNHAQHTSVETISIRRNNRCTFKVVFRLKAGFSDIFYKKHPDVFYSLPRVLKTSCVVTSAGVN